MKPVRFLAFTAVSSAILAAACIGGAYALASANDSGLTEIVTREIPWDRSNSLALALPSTTRYIQAPGPGKIVVRGPHRSVSTLTVKDGRIFDRLLHTGAVIELTVTAPNVTTFKVEGDSRLAIEAYDQDRLTLTIDGVAQITASGRTGAASVTVTSGGTANLARLRTESLTGSTGSLGIIIAAPSANADLRINGAAILLTRPPNLTTRIEGHGQLIDASPT